MSEQQYSVTYRLDQPRWDDFVKGCPGATAYHLYAWRRVIENSFGHSSHYLAAVDPAGSPQGVLPLFHMKSALFGNFLVSVPFVNYGGLLCRSSLAAVELLKEADRLRRELSAHHVELRHLGGGLPQLPTRIHKVTMLLKLAASPELQWSSFNAKLRNQIRKAEKSGLSCVIGGSELLDGFYSVFARNMRDLGTPVYGKEFFDNVLACLPEATRVVAVNHRGMTIAAGIAYFNGPIMEFPWASSISDFREFCPNNMLYWEAIRFAISKGESTFDFGRSTVGEGTFNFKKQWGAQPVQLYWQYLLDDGEALPELTTQNPKFRMAIRAWKLMPVAVSKLLGPLVVRNIP